MPEAAYALSAFPSTPGACPSAWLRAVERELLQLGRIAGDDAGEVHHLREADHAPATQEALEIPGRQRASRGLEGRRGHAGRGGEVDVQRQAGAHVEQPVDTVAAEDVRDLVRIGDDGRRPHRQHEPRELVHEQLRRLEVHVRVDEAGDDVGAADVERLRPFVVAEARDVAVADGDVGLEPLAREDREHAAALDDEVGRLVPACDRYAAGEISHERVARSLHS